MLSLTVTVVVVVLVVLILVGHEVRQGRVSESRLQEEPACESLSDQRADHTVSILVSLLVSHPGSVCVRIVNGAQALITYTIRTLRLERRWLGVLWFPYVRPRDVLSVVGGTTMQDGLPTVLPGVYRDVSLCSPDTPGGMYRVRLRYRVRGEKGEPTVHSAAFSLP